MARVPQYQQQVSPDNLPSARLSNPFTPDAMGAGVGVAVTRVGGMVGEIAQREQEKADIAAVMSAERELADLELRLFYDPEQGAYAKKGRDTFGLPEAVWPTWDQSVSSIESRLTPQQKLAFQRQAASRRQELQRGLFRHIASESDNYYRQETAAYIDTAAAGAAANYNDPDRIALEVERAQRAVLSLDDGASPEVRKQRLQQASGAVHGAVMDRLVSESPEQAWKYLLANEDRLEPPAAARYRAALRPVMRAYEATRIVDGMVGGTGAAPTADVVWANIMAQESRGRQFGPDGKPLTSSAGAIGIAQVMPDTAPEAARLAGLPWNEQRYRTDPDYNEALGRAYFDAQLAKYGDPRLAAAAYNGGPGNLDKWLKEYGDPRKGEISFDDWVAAIPFKETREYVQKVVPAGGGAGRSETGEIQLSTLLREARSITDPELRRAVTDEVRGRFEIEKLEREEQEASMLERLSSKIEEAPPGAKLTDVLTPDEYAWAASQGKVAAYEQRLVQRLQNAEPATDPNLLSTLQTLFSKAENGDPIALSEVRKLDPTTLYARLNSQARDYVQNRRLAILSPKGDGKGDTTPDFASEDALLRVEVWGKLGVPATGGTPENEATRAQFLQSYWSRVNALQTASGKKATSEQKQQIMRDLLLPFAKETKRPWLPDTVEELRAFEIEIPDADRAQITAAYQRRFGRAPSEEEVLSVYASANNMTMNQGSP